MLCISSPETIPTPSSTESSRPPFPPQDREDSHISSMLMPSRVAL